MAASSRLCARTNIVALGVLISFVCRPSCCRAPARSCARGALEARRARQNSAAGSGHRENSRGICHACYLQLRLGAGPSASISIGSASRRRHHRGAALRAFGARWRAAVAPIGRPNNARRVAAFSLERRCCLNKAARSATIGAIADRRVGRHGGIMASMKPSGENDIVAAAGEMSAFGHLRPRKSYLACFLRSAAGMAARLGCVSWRAPSCADEAVGAAIGRWCQSRGNAMPSRRNRHRRRARPLCARMSASIRAAPLLSAEMPRRHGPSRRRRRSTWRRPVRATRRRAASADMPLETAGMEYWRRDAACGETTVKEMNRRPPYMAAVAPLAGLRGLASMAVAWASTSALKAPTASGGAYR